MTKDRELVIARVREVLDLAYRLYPETELALRNVDVRFDIRGFTTAGQARRKAFRYWLRFNPLCVEHDLQKILDIAVPHEVAHLVCYASRELGKNHDSGWKRVCRALGGDGERTIDISFGPNAAAEQNQKRLARRPYVYIDSKGVERRYTANKHRKVQAGWSYRWRDNGALVNRDSAYRYDPVSAPKKSAPKVARKTARTPRTNETVTKAQVCRNLIKEFYGRVTDDQLVAKIMAETGLSKGLAKKYFRNNLPKVIGEN